MLAFLTIRQYGRMALEVDGKNLDLAWWGEGGGSEICNLSYCASLSFAMFTS